jgi:hypothetical protein
MKMWILWETTSLDVYGGNRWMRPPVSMRNYCILRRKPILDAE